MPTALIENMPSACSARITPCCARAVSTTRWSTIKATLDSSSACRFDRFQSERALLDAGAIEHGVEPRCKAKGFVYEKDGATWLATEKLGDEKDRVLIRADGAHTYFAADVAYHVAKVERGFDTADGGVGRGPPRLHRAGARVPSKRSLVGASDFEVALIQFVTLASGKMGKRSGNFVTLKDLIDEAGRDATRFFYLNRSNDQHLEFDLELARSQSNDNPVFYVQYAHARICERVPPAGREGPGLGRGQGSRAPRIGSTDRARGQALLRDAGPLPRAWSRLAARERAPHHLPHYLREAGERLPLPTTTRSSSSSTTPSCATRASALVAATRVVIAERPERCWV